MTLGTRSDEGTAKWDAIGRNGAIYQRKVVGTLRVPFLIMPDTIQIKPIGIEIQLHTQCAYYFGPPLMR